MDFLKYFNIERPLFISTDEFDTDFSTINSNVTAALIRYTSSEEEDLAKHLHFLYHLGDLTMIVFLDGGHQELINILVNEVILFDKGLGALIPEADVIEDLDLKLRPDSKLYLYANQGSTIDLKEMFAINGNTVVGKIGTWHETTGLSVPTTNMWMRRANLGGMTIRVATISHPMLHELYHDEQTGTSRGRGSFLEPLNILETRLNFTLKFLPSIDGFWGSLDENGTWNGLVGMLIKDQADIVAASIAQTKERGNVTTFGIALQEDEITLMLSQTAGPEVHPWIYLDIFPQITWGICGAMALSIAICFALINYSGINHLHKTQDSERFTVLNGLGLSLTFFRQIYYDINIEGISTRILFALSAVSTYLLYVHYTAYLTAASTHASTSSIKSFKDVIIGGFKVLVLENSASHDILKAATIGTPMHEVYYKTMNNNPRAFAQSTEEAYKMLQSEKKVLFYDNTALYEGLKFLDIQGRLWPS